jgi:hypothetical protein
MQTGQVFKLDKSWAYRYRTPDGRRPQKAGFATKGEARAALNETLRRLSLGGRYRREPPTLAALVSEYLAQHVAEDITLQTLRYRLQHAMDSFGSARVDRLTPSAIGAWRKQLPAVLGSLHSQGAPTGSQVRRPLQVPRGECRGGRVKPCAQAGRDEDLLVA